MKIYEKERVFVRQYSYIAAGVMVLLFGGIIYAWSTLSVPMIAEFKEWTLSQISFTFTLCTLFFCIGGFLRGLIASKYSIRFTMLAAAILGCAGMLLTAQTTNNILFLYCGFGVLSGFSIGLAYNTVMSTVTSYFDTNRGTVSGILLMGFGFGSFVMGKIYQTLLSNMILDWHGIFRLFAIAILLIFVLAGFVLKENSEETHEITTLESSIPTMDMTTKEMLHTRVFWTYFLWAILLASSLVIAACAGSPIASRRPLKDSRLFVVSQVTLGIVQLQLGLENGTQRSPAKITSSGTPLTLTD